MNTLRAPNTDDEFVQYYHLRWEILRKPWQQSLGSEQDANESYAIHRMVIENEPNEQKKMLAVGRLERVNNQQGQIRYMAVANQQQGQGLGRQIIEALEYQASKLGMTEIYLNARENSIGFYQKLGYKKQGYSHTLFDELKHYRMIKNIVKPKEHQEKIAQLLQDLWHKTIPLSKAMALQISYYDKTELITHCDAVFNQNLHHTMFAGSIYTLATLTGWGWVYLTLQSYIASQDNQLLDGDIVLAQADIRYHSPIKGLAYGQVKQENVSGEFTKLAHGKKVRINLVVHVCCGDRIAATFNGSYFVLPKEDGNHGE